MTYSPFNFTISHKKRFIRGCMIILGIGLILLSLGRNSSSENKTLWIIDNSLSMMVEDITSGTGVIDSRLSLAKKIIESNSHVFPGEQAILSVAYGAKLEIPMTDDLSLLSNVTHGINPIIRGGGTTVSAPLETVRLLYGEIRDLQIFWLTDGEFSDSGSTFSGKLNTKNITFIGLGTRSGGPIPLGYDTDGKPRYKEVDGQRITSIRDDESLKKVAKTLDANLMFLDSSKNISIDGISKNKHDANKAISWYMFFGGLFIIVGLMVPRYNYFFK